MNEYQPKTTQELLEQASNLAEQLSDKLAAQLAIKKHLQIALLKAEAQRDELLEACKALMDTLRYYRDDALSFQNALKVIASIEGGAK